MVMRRKGQATNEQLERCAEGLDSLASFFYNLARVAGMLSNSIDEVKRYRNDVQKGRKTLDFASFTRNVKRRDAELGEALNDFELESFRLGKLTGYAKDGFNYSLLSIKKDQIVKFLGREFNFPFDVSIKHKKS